MGTSAVDAGDFRQTQHKSWDAAAIGWNAWRAFNDRADAHISRRIVELAGVGPGSRVLDIAAGYGEPSLTAARVAGPDGRVVATDISAEMLGFARDRAAAAGLGNVEFVQADASSLAFPDATFDAAVSRWGIIFEPDAEATAARIRHFLRPGSRMAISSWGTPDEVPFLSLPMRTTMQRFGLPPLPPGTPGPLSRPTPAAIGGLLEGSGFSAVEIERHTVVFPFDSPAHFTSYVRAVAAPIRTMIAQHTSSDDEAEAAWDAITDAAAELGSGTGPLQLTNVVLIAAGRA